VKRFRLILLALGLIMTFNISALAADVKFNGSYYAAGMYLDRTTLVKDTGFDGPSTAFYFQRLRVQMEFIVSPALKLVTRFDAMERAWGAPRSTPGNNPGDFIMNGASPTSAGTTAENENIAFDLAYIQYASPIGIFVVGYQINGNWGTVFGDTSTPGGDIGWIMQKGPWTAMIHIGKLIELSKTATFPSPWTDVDDNKYAAMVIYRWNSGETGLLYSYERNAIWRPTGTVIYKHSLQPYAKAKIGPLALQAELDYYWGKAKGEDGNISADLQAINFFLDAVTDFNMFYAGGTFAYLSGDDPGTNDKEDGSWMSGPVGGGYDWNPCLIMFNFDHTYWAGVLPGWGILGIDSPMSNTWFGQLRGGVRPVAALDIMASVSYAKADKTYTGVDKEYGWEVDLIATYKITNNLSYMLGGGYLFTGDYFKGTATYGIKDDFLIINKLTLTF
jgi:hypothetical protein